jgi:hypothetical protein
MADSENLKSYREFCGTRNAPFSPGLILYFFDLVPVISGPHIEDSDNETTAPDSIIRISSFHCGSPLRLESAGARSIVRQCGTAGGILIAIGETLSEVQNRLLPIGATINGVRGVDNNTSVPLFKAIPGYCLVNVRGGFRFDETQQVSIDFENILDKSHRSPGLGGSMDQAAASRPVKGCSSEF